MGTRIATYRKLLFSLGIVFVATRLLVFFVFKSDPFRQWSLASTLYSPFLAPALGGAFVIHLAARRDSSKELAATALLGVLLAVLHQIVGRRWLNIDAEVTINVTFGLGLASLLVNGARAVLGPREARDERLSILLPSMILPSFVLLSTFLLAMTAVLHPMVYDASVYAADSCFGLQPSFALARIFGTTPWLTAICRIVYWGLPLALASVYAARRVQRADRSDEVLFSFVAIGFFGSVLYHLYPVAGPYFFFGKNFPNDPTVLPAPTEGYLVALPVPRNCMPSLHTAWALLLYWQCRPLGRYLRALAAAWLLFTMTGALGFGYHYALDIVVAFPFTMAISAAFNAAAPRADRRRVIAIGATLTAAWFVALRFFPPPIGDGGPARLVLALATVVLSFVVEGTLYRRAALAPESEPVPAEVKAIRLSPAELAIATVFFVSGFSGLIYEIVFAKSLALTFGSTATASTTVLATYMGGISLGAWIGGELGVRRSDPLRVYAFCEVGIAIYCALTPWLFSGIRALYVTLASGIDPGRPILVPLQAALGALVLLPPTTLMGITMPVLTKQFAGRADFGRAIGLLYGANTLGAAAGSWLTGYVVLSFLGVTGTTWLAVLANLCVGLMALRLSARFGLEQRQAVSITSSDSNEASAAPRSAGVIAALVLGVGGMVTLALETTDIHLLAVVAGNSVYAFALMLFAFLIGLGFGAAGARRLLRGGPANLFHLGILELGLAATILVGVHGWEKIPEYFGSFAGYPLARTFGERELIRFVVCSVMMIPPAFFIGTLFPMAMDLVTRAADNPVRATGRASALNTLGNITGAIMGGFFLVPRLGSLRALQVLAAIALGLGLLPAFWLARRRQVQLAAGAAFVVFLLAAQPKTFDYDQLAAGTNVYFQPTPHGRVVAHAESLDGGLTTVNEARMPDGTRVLTLLTNGKFQGDTSGEMKAQYGYALYPLLHTTARDEALVIGLGTGVSAATVRWAGFRHVDIAELSGDIVSLTDAYFAGVTGGILRQPGVDLHVTDGRNFLLLTRTAYDLVTIEVSSIWFAGAASLYNREFYRLVKTRLRPEGVLQQWVQLHRIGVEDLVSILGTVRSEFPRVWLYFTGAQGMIIACNHDCEPTAAALARIESAPDLAGPLASLEGRMARLIADRVLSPQSVDKFLDDVAAHGLGANELVSTDDNLFLEYNTPRGNVREYEPSLKTNVALLKTFSPRALTDGTRLTEGDLQPARLERERPEE